MHKGLGPLCLCDSNPGCTINSQHSCDYKSGGTCDLCSCYFWLKLFLVGATKCTVCLVHALGIWYNTQIVHCTGFQAWKFNDK